MARRPASAAQVSTIVDGLRAREPEQPNICDHCGTPTLAMNPVDPATTDCPCYCHTARRAQLARAAERRRLDAKKDR